MPAYINKVIVQGNLGADPDIKTTRGGGSMAVLSLATTEFWRDKSTNEKREATEWHRVVVFADGLVKVLEKYARKGTSLFVEGKLRTRKWEDKSGNKRYTTEIVVQGFGGTILFNSNKKTDQSAAPAEHAPPERVPGEDDELDDKVPF